MCLVGDGSSTFLWYDNWYSYGLLLDISGNGVVLVSGLHINSKLSYVNRVSEWCWPFTPTQLSFSFNQIPITLCLLVKVWIPPFGFLGTTVFCLRLLCGIASIRWLLKFLGTTWRDIVHLFHMNFVLWLTIKNKLTKLDHISQFAPFANLDRVFCEYLSWNMTHICFECPL